jgi:hypothetical protein
MKKLKSRQPYNHHFEYTSDIERIVKVFAARGYEISDTDAVHAWESFSQSMCAGWMCLGNDTEVFNDAIYYFEEIDENI